eukprot:362691-Chlamydomonas_euryale.AAC.4
MNCQGDAKPPHATTTSGGNAACALKDVRGAVPYHAICDVFAYAHGACPKGSKCLGRVMCVDPRSLAAGPPFAPVRCADAIALYEGRDCVMVSGMSYFLRAYG